MADWSQHFDRIREKPTAGPAVKKSIVASASKKKRSDDDSDDPGIQMMLKAKKVRDEAGYKVIIAGSRIIDTDRAVELLREHWKRAVGLFGAVPTRIVSGACPRGVDPAGEQLAKELTGKRAHTFPALWDHFGKNAGPIRNIDMVSCSNALFLIWDGQSSGSNHVRTMMEIRDRPVYEIEISRR